MIFASGMRPNPAVNADARRRGFARAAVAGYLTRQGSVKMSQVRKFIYTVAFAAFGVLLAFGALNLRCGLC